MLTQSFQDRRFPAKVFQHLTGGFSEINDCHGTVEASVLGLRYQVVDCVSEFVEERDCEVEVVDTCWLTCGRFIVAAQECR